MSDLNSRPHITVIIPALDEQESVGLVLDDLPQYVDDVIVVDNASTDDTARVAREAGARVVHEPHRGYGAACLAGIRAIDNTDIVVFLDADYSDRPQELSMVVAPIFEGRADLVIGSRLLGERERGALLPQAVWGNRLAVGLMKVLLGARFTDLGPFRAVRWPSLQSLLMSDTGYGWTVEMQIKAVRFGLSYCEVPVSYRRRIGKSKISGTVAGTLGAGCKIILTILRLTLQTAFVSSRHAITIGAEPMRAARDPRR